MGGGGSRVGTRPRKGRDFRIPEGADDPCRNGVGEAELGARNEILNFFFLLQNPRRE